mgnify:CR=1 FL=1
MRNKIADWLLWLSLKVRKKPMSHYEIYFGRGRDD